MHYVLIIGTVLHLFPTYEDCAAVAKATGGQCVARSYGTGQTTKQVTLPLVPLATRPDKPVGTPYRTQEQIIEDNARRYYEERKVSDAFIEGFAEEMQKPEGQDV